MQELVYPRFVWFNASTCVEASWWTISTSLGINYLAYGTNMYRAGGLCIFSICQTWLAPLAIFNLDAYGLMQVVVWGQVGRYSLPQWTRISLKHISALGFVQQNPRLRNGLNKSNPLKIYSPTLICGMSC